MGPGIRFEQDFSNIERVLRKRPERGRQKVNQRALFEI